MGVYCEIHPYNLGLAEIRRLGPQALVLSGGPASVYGDGAPRVDPALFALGIPTLGISRVRDEGTGDPARSA